MNLVEKEWLKFIQRAGITSNPRLVEALRTAFFAGAFTTLHTLQNAESEHETVTAMMNIIDELNAYKAKTNG